jgi:hypothetical protein
MLHLSLLTKRALFASLLLCLLTGQLAASKHSIDHFFHDQSSYCDSLAPLEHGKANIASPMQDTACYLPLKTDKPVNAQLRKACHLAYNSRAPPVFTLV